MKSFLQRKWFLIVGLTAACVAVVVIYFLYMLLRGDGGAGNLDNYQVASVDPTSLEVLLPGVPVEFSAVFAGEIEEQNIEARLLRTEITGARKSFEVPVAVVLGEDKKTLSVTSEEDVMTYSIYTLSLIDVATQKTILSQDYNSALHDLRPAVDNNLDLVPFLPHETESYKLSYLPELNTYIFNFKANPALPTSYIEQYNQAKSDAESYIRSVGVDPATIAIEWKHS